MVCSLTLEFLGIPRVLLPKETAQIERVMMEIWTHYCYEPCGRLANDHCPGDRTISMCPGTSLTKTGFHRIIECIWFIWTHTVTVTLETTAWAPRNMNSVLNTTPWSRVYAWWKRNETETDFSSEHQTFGCARETLFSPWIHMKQCSCSNVHSWKLNLCI